MNPDELNLKMEFILDRQAEFVNRTIRRENG